MEENSSDKIRIKDIAQEAGVSVGTVDRVLHGRPNVSPKAKAKVDAVLRRINYHPNMYASALATNKKYQFVCLVPKHEKGDYWQGAEQGMADAGSELKDFRVSIKFVYYDQYSHVSFAAKADEVVAEQPDGVAMVPHESEPTRVFTERLNAAGIPYTFVDSNYADLNPLAFYGQDSIRSGYFAARIFMMDAGDVSEVFVFKQAHGGHKGMRQSEFREIGFRRYFQEHCPECAIHELALSVSNTKQNGERMANFFREHPALKHGITFTSRAYVAGEYLAKMNRRDIHIFGYDVLPRNVACVQKGTISFLIAQHSWIQGHGSVRALFDHLVLHKEVTKNNYMPIELLTPENIEFYRQKGE